MEGLWTVSLDQTGLAQKGGPIATHLRTSRHVDELLSNRIGEGGADLFLAYDLVEATQPGSLNTTSTQKTARSRYVAYTHRRTDT